MTHYPPCNPCNGTGLRPADNGGAYKCPACGGNGISKKWQRLQTELRRQNRQKEYEELLAQVEELYEAIKLFEVRTNLDGVILRVAEERYRAMQNELIYRNPKRRKNA